MNQFINALLLGAGYNAALVCIGAALLGFSAGAAGTFLVLRKRSLVCKAAASATLPGIVLAFIVMALLGGDGRNIFGLMAGATITAWLGIAAIDWIARNTRLQEDAAIGTVLSVSFGIGLVLLTIIQSLGIGRPSGLEKLLLGSIAGMLYQDAIIIAVGGTLISVITFLLRRQMTLVAFDAEYAAVQGYNVPLIDLTILTLGVAITVVGLKVVGLILVIGLLIIPTVAARYWTVRPDHMLFIAGILGATAAYVGAAISASAPNLPAGPVIVLVAIAFFTFSILFAPERGLLVAAYEAWELRKRALTREGLLGLVRGEKIESVVAYLFLYAGGVITYDKRLTNFGRETVAKCALDERRWQIAQALYPDMNVVNHYYAFAPLEQVFTARQTAGIDRTIRKISQSSERRKAEQRARALAYLANKRDGIKAKVEKRISALLKQVLVDRRKAAQAYADWFWGWGTSWALLWKGCIGAVKEISRAGISYSTIREAVRQAIKGYLLEHYTSKMLKPDMRMTEIRAGFKTIIEEAHVEYRQALAKLDGRFQDCAHKHTACAAPEYDDAMSVIFDREAQTWNMPRLSDDSAFARSLVSAVIVTACLLGGLVIEVLADARELDLTTTTLGMEIPLIGLLVGAGLGGVVDYTLNWRRRNLEREKFVMQNLSEIEATEHEWHRRMCLKAHNSIDIWFGHIQKAITNA